KQMRDLVREGVAPADDVPRGPPELHERMLGLGDQDSRKALRFGDLELVEAVAAEGDRPLRAVDLDRVEVDPAAAQARRPERATGGACELDRGHEMVVHGAAGDDGAYEPGDGRDLADEVPGEVDDVGAEVADRTRSRLGAVEAPDAFVRLPAPALQVG